MMRSWSILLLAVVSSSAFAAEPLVRNLNLRGLQLEGATTLVVDGDHLAAARLLLPFTAKAELKPDSTEKKATFDVTVAGDVHPGYYNLRLVTDGGVSQPLLVGVDKLPQKTLAATIDQLPVALHGTVGGSNVVEARFAGKAGQAITIEVEAQRIDSKLRPVLHLYNAKRRQLAWSWPAPTLGGDTRLEATLPEDGEYTIALHDLEYGPPGPGYFRLKVGQWSCVDQLFPPVVEAGLPAKIEVGLPALPLDVTANAATLFAIALPNTQVWSGPRPYVVISEHAEVLEQPPAPEGGQPLPEGIVGVSGRLATPLEEDKYRITTQPGAKVRLEVFAERYGSPIDAAIVVRNEKGDVLARGEDSPGTVDPVLEYTPPAQVNSVVVGVVDAGGRGSQRGIYRLVVTPENAVRNSFRLSAPAQRVSFPQGGRALVPVFVERHGYEGPIELSLQPSAAGVRTGGTTIPAGRNGGIVALIRDGAVEAAVVSLVGQAADGRQQPVTFVDPQPGRSRGTTFSRIQPWLDQELAIAPSTANAAAFQIDWRDLPAEAALIPGRKLPLPIKLVRPMDNVAVRLTLLTSQEPQLNNGQLDQNRMLRAERAVELAANAAEGQIDVLVPADLPLSSYQFALEAELLTADKQSVAARAFTPVRDLPVRHQLAIQLTTPLGVEVPLDAKTGAMVKLEGKIERREGLTGDVQVALTGLPPGVQAGAVNVKADASDFALNVVFPASTMPGEVKNLKLTASAADSQNNNVRVTSQAVPITIVVQPASPAQP